ncbi:hypothetical protein ACWOC0_02150, partial [Enterococcus italicus]
MEIQIGESIASEFPKLPKYTTNTCKAKTGSLSNRTDRFTNEHRKRGGNSFSGVFLFVGNETIKQENSRTH